MQQQIWTLQVPLQCSKILNWQVLLELHCDNMDMIHTFLKEVTSWRSRHYAVCAAWARDTVKEPGVHVNRVPGVELGNDLLRHLDALCNNMFFCSDAFKGENTFA